MCKLVCVLSRLVYYVLAGRMCFEWTGMLCASWWYVFEWNGLLCKLVVCVCFEWNGLLCELVYVCVLSGMVCYV